MGVLVDSDVLELISYLLGSFGVGFCSGAILRIFRKFAERSVS